MADEKATEVPQIGTQAKIEAAAVKAKLIKDKRKALDAAVEVLEQAKRERADAEQVVRKKTLEVNALRAELVDLM